MGWVVMRFALLAAILSLGCALAAQEAASSPRLNQSVLPHVFGIDIFPVKGKPFSGRDCLDVPHHLSDGSVQTAHLDGARLARNSDGRVYREIRSWIFSSSDPQSILDYMIFVDPVAHTRTECKPSDRVCKVFGYPIP